VDLPGQQYYALPLPGSERPALVYRRALPGENTECYVTSILDHYAYLQSLKMSDDPLAQASLCWRPDLL
jgi:hypothetical protein